MAESSQASQPAEFTERGLLKCPACHKGRLAWQINLQPGSRIVLGCGRCRARIEVLAVVAYELAIHSAVMPGRDEG